MRTTVVRRTTLAAGAAVLALLVSACGGSSDDGDQAGADSAKDGTTASSAPAAPAPKALTAAELDKAVLAQADVKSGEVNKMTPAYDAAKDQVKSDKAACASLAFAQTGVPLGDPAGSVKRIWTDTPERPTAGADAEEALVDAVDLDQALVTLASYDDGGAESVLKDVKKAAGECAGGFGITAVGESYKIAKVTEGTAPGGADEAVALTLGLADEGGEATAPVRVLVARKGSTVASFSVMNLGAAITGKDAPFPTEISDAQLAKLG